MIIVITITLLFLALRLTVTVFNFVSNPKLTRINRAYTDSVSILIPARNEENNILALLQSIKQQDYKNYEVIVYDDDSADKTFAICTEFAAGQAEFKVIKGEKLPAGWTGKNHACYQLVKQAKGNFLLFLDADEVVKNGLINSAIHRMHLYKLNLLSLFADQDMKTFGEKITVPLLHYLLLNLFPVRAIFLTKNPAFATACGQFMLFDAETYRANQWHELVKDKIIEDAAIMKQVKTTGYKGELLLANGMLLCRMYNGYREAISGFSRGALAAFNYSVPALFVYILLLMAGPMIVIMTLNINLVVYTLGLILLTRLMISLSSNQNPLYNMVMHPLQMVNMTIIAFLSVQRHLTKTNTWKGRGVV